MTAHPEGMSCTADETLAAFIDDRLSSAEKRAVIEHLAECGECRSLVIDATELKAAEGNLIRPRFGAGRRRTAIGVALAAAAALAVVFGPPLWERFSKPGIDDLVVAYGSSPVRLIQGRLSGDFAYREFEGPKRGAAEERPFREDQLVLSSKAYEVVSENPNDAHAVGVARLLVSEQEKAIDSLRLALAGANGEERTKVANDLAVALIAYGAFHGDRAATQEALDLVERELRTSRTPELLWNRALALGNLGRRDEAKKAWNDYLEVDPSSQWAQEVRDRHLRDDDY